MRKNGKNGLPLGSGLYWKREVIYVELWHGGKRLGQFSTATSDTYQALKFKDAKLAELLKAEETQIADLAKGVRVSDLLQDYVANLERRETDCPGIRTQPWDTTPLICCWTRLRL